MDDKSLDGKKLYLGARHALAIMGFLASATMYMQKLDLSIAIVAMAGGVKGDGDNENGGSFCKSNLNGNLSSIVLRNDSGSSVTVMATSDEVNQAEFDWSPLEKSELLASYYYGNVLSQILAGWLSAKFGFKRVVGISMIVCSFLSILTPQAAEMGFYYLLILRCLLGFLQGFIFTPLHGCWNVWASPQEYTFLAAFPMAGTSIGTVVIFPLGGVLAATLGWRWVFYVTGSLNLLLSAIWWPLVYDTPEGHRWISEKEKSYLVDSQKDTMGANAPVGRTPWFAMLTSGPVWAIFISHIASNWGLYQLQALMPTYLNDVLGLDLYSNGVFNSLPYLLQTLTIFFCGYLTDYLIAHKYIRTLYMRQINTAICLAVPAACLLVAGYSGCHNAAVITAFIVAGAANSFIYGGSLINMFDFAPRYAPIIYGMSNTLGQTAGFLAPVTAGLLLKDQNDHNSWLLAFWVSALAHVPGLIAFQCFSTDQIQDWAKEDPNDNDPELTDNEETAVDAEKEEVAGKMENDKEQA